MAATKELDAWPINGMKCIHAAMNFKTKLMNVMMEQNHMMSPKCTALCDFAILKTMNTSSAISTKEAIGKDAMIAAVRI